MLIINRLYSEPESFEEVKFQKGINLILGEKNSSSNKTNGVGKTLLIEFLNFCLLKDFKNSRVSKIPESSLNKNTFICLDFNIGSNRIISKRKTGAYNNPILIINNKTIEFSSIDDATQTLTKILFSEENNSQHPSFRAMMGPLIRDERSEFKSIIDCYDTELKIPPDLTPHLYLLGISVPIYLEIKEIIKEIKTLTETKRKLKNDIEGLTGKNISSAKSEINDLKSQTENIKFEMENLENSNSYDLVKDEVTILETNLSSLRTKRSILKAELSRINLFTGDNYIDDSEVIELYNQFKNGLGDFITKELNQVISFKKTIDNFQRNLLDARKEAISSEIKDLTNSIKQQNISYSEKIKVFDSSGGLHNLKTLVLIYQKKLEECSQLSALLKKHDDYDSQIKFKKSEKSTLIIDLDESINLCEQTIIDFQETILMMHEYVFYNKKCSLEINTVNTNKIINIELRIDDDGSHSNEREKVFFYDMALLLTDDTYKRHPGILIHDNIFDVDHDTLIRSLNFLAEKASCLKDVQYILTLNRDKINSLDKKTLKLDIDKYRRASLTKNGRFLGKVYREK
ncbi:Protein of unknown function DUF2326 [Rahnella aceris]|uniref:DUF2326 domain-containing protein n=1 Tax=Rahnella sp. (strain Y9602) TaxID=2703885 RepID=A0A0H3F7A9_RAHSY|nr:DUF2326 domain-containing protein [Rahnella aceris]ADW72804.1 Protein of unknown function DUF2326 [Rahnella aceris]